MNSIRRTLLVRLMAGATVAVLAGAAAIWFKAYDEASAIFDSQLESMAYTLRDRLVARMDASGIDSDDDTAHLVVVQIWDRSGGRLYLSHAEIAMPQRSQLGFSNVSTAQGEWRVFGLQSPNQTVQVAQPLSVRRDLAARLALRTLWPVLLLLPLFGLLTWATVGQGLHPLRVLAGELRARRADSLDPLAPGPVQEELQPMVGALNDLLARLARAMQSQREFVADAAHELRTPLAVVRLQAQNAALAATDAERSAALARLQEGVDRATGLVQQLLTLARQAPEAAARPRAPVDLAALARSVAADHAQLAAAGNIDLGVADADPLAVEGDAQALHTLLSNLVGNAIRYTPPGGRVDVSVHALDGGAALEVLDTGPGIAPEERVRVFDRFYRAAGSSVPGSGLGLAIVRSIAEAHGARVLLEDRPDGAAGLRARVVFGDEGGARGA